MVVPKGPGLHTEPPELVPGVSHQDKGFHGQSLCVCVWQGKVSSCSPFENQAHSTREICKHMAC